MTIKIYADLYFTCGQRVALILKELNVPYEVINVELAKGEHKAPSFVAHQPFGQVPYIVDEDGFELYESRAIGRYLVAKYGKNTGLIPGLDDGDVQKLGKFEQAASIEISNFDPYAGGIVGEKIFKPYLNMGTDEAAVARHAATLDSKLDAYEFILSKQKYLAGDEISLADLFHIPGGAFLGETGSDALTNEKRPNVARWWKEISSRPAWKAVKSSTNRI